MKIKNYKNAPSKFIPLNYEKKSQYHNEAFKRLLNRPPPIVNDKTFTPSTFSYSSHK